MRKTQSALLAAVAIIGLASTASAADLAYKAPPPPLAPVFSWSGFYGGVYGGSGFTGNGAISITGDPTSAAYNNLANGGVGQVTNAIFPAGVSCVTITGCAGAVVATSVTPNNNPGFRNDLMFPASQNSSQMRGLFGGELGVANNSII